MTTRPIPHGYAETVHEAAVVDEHNAKFQKSAVQKIQAALASLEEGHISLATSLLKIAVKEMQQS